MLVTSSPARPDSVKVLNRVPMGSRGCPTQPSMLVMEVWPLWSNSENNINIKIINFHRYKTDLDDLDGCKQRKYKSLTCKTRLAFLVSAKVLQLSLLLPP